ncbi:MAG: hypothetical protein IJZ68_01070 [Bacteroidaceae bacterium]|nr:hypothetical protein [Bacteroidaceae bacterium]
MDRKDSSSLSAREKREPLKIAIDQREPVQDRGELQAQMQEHMVANQRNSEKMQRFFHKETVKYAPHMEN